MFSFKKSQEKFRSAHNCLEENEGLNEIVCLVYEPTGTGMGDYWILFLEMTDLLISMLVTSEICLNIYPRLTKC